MLTPELMGALALGILWVNTLLVAGAALGQLRGLLGRMRELRAIRRARVLSAPEEGFARFEVEQVGRKAADDDDRQAILFHDRERRSHLSGGEIEMDGRRCRIDGGEAEVWVDRAALEEAAACPSRAIFDEAYARARKAKGYTRTVRVRLEEALYLAGPVSGERFDGVVASFDPRPLLRKKAALLVGFALAMVAASGGITALCLVPPAFGLWSTLGGVLGLVHFLGVLQPAGVAARDVARLPPETALSGSWVKPGSEGEGAPAPGTELYAPE